ncbi:MAG TPA: laccase domain-containing protein [Caldilineae bacterium]|nr:laccase domain-containing protein [Caldilineae bacterium]
METRVVARVAESAVRAMQEGFGTNPADLVSAVGPAIGPCCYEVGPEVVAAISTSQRDPDHLFSPSLNGGGKAYLDLWEANARISLPRRPGGGGVSCIGCWAAQPPRCD